LIVCRSLLNGIRAAAALSSFAISFNLCACLILLQWYTSSEHLPAGELLTGPMFSGNLYRYDNAQVSQTNHSDNPGGLGANPNRARAAAAGRAVQLQQHARGMSSCPALRRGAARRATGRPGPAPAGESDWAAA
jgi:hypothetical protein